MQNTSASTGSVYLIGAAGQLGRALIARIPDTREPARVRPLTSADIDITDATSVAVALAGLTADDVVINTAAYTDVDAAETDRAAAYRVNADGPAHLARATAAVGAWLIHISTDYVFSGSALGGTSERPDEEPEPRTTPYEPDESGAVVPATVYGASKLAGERAALAADGRTTVVRTAWVYTGGPDSRDFVGTMRRLEQTRETVSVVDDQLGSPTYALDLADGLWELVSIGPVRGIAGATLHATNGGRATWCDVARAVFIEVGADADRVHPCTTAEFPRPAPRPAFSVLSGASWADAGLTPLPEWSAALHRAIAAPVAADGSLP
ncbi:dTDP-4-dehydrorhamnose reductase [Gordonia sp. ABSL1-1]|uniref:dTDP-4-dehydrorhamnose reductase n=1 Tax=Gordonia sp. ABSL1-1 TaxID=3053923 RepID=UPI002573A322|nr:dTDP-4-dehydrorhamnose reductase [Gordonia sp. ABSL1-1]MDL9937081.1 dTDP-4-dehydrorhamnose reductase [Gordonia sp. ABSL1-1]